MRVLFVHQNYPAQFGFLARMLERHYGWETVFATKWEGKVSGQKLVRYAAPPGVTEDVDFLARNFEATSRQSLAVYRAVRDAGLRGKIDLVVGHSGFGSSLFLGDLLGCPVVNLFEFFYRTSAEGKPFRPEFPLDEAYKQRLRVLNACILLDLHRATAGYTPTHFQRNQFPSEYLPKIETLFDGVDHTYFRRREGLPRVIAGRTIPDHVKIVTYVSRGFESMRGFDIFVRVAKRVYAEHPDVLFVCVGSDRVCYGGDMRYIKEKSFREHVWKAERPDDSKFLFTGRVPTNELVDLLSLGDAHVYFTVPFVLSWSLFNAMSCGCRIVSCDTGPVREVLVNGRSGLLADFFDVEAHARNVLRILKDPTAHDGLGRSARQTVTEKYSLVRTVPAFARLFARVGGREVPRPRVPLETGGAAQ